MKPIEWEALSAQERAYLGAASETSPLAFTAIWFGVTTGDVFKVNWHHLYFEWAINKVLAGEAHNVVINVAPGSTKTEIFSIHLPAYCATKFPKARILNSSYSKDLTVENSERTRSLIKSDEYQSLYPSEIGKDTSDNWSIIRGGRVAFQIFSRSNGGQITGARGGYMGDGFTGYVSADDFDKPDDMFSDAKRKKSHTRLVNTLRSRRAKADDEDPTPMLFIQQRLHVDDSSAFILSGGMGLRVDLHITIPALIDEEYINTKVPEELRDRCRRDVYGSEQIDGKWSYWPAKEGIRNLMALRDANPYTFLSQYMQEPDTLDGGIFSADDFLYFGSVDDGADLPEPARFEYRFITVDTAQKTNTWNDWTVFAEWGVFEGRIYRLAMQRAKMKADQLRRDFTTFVRASHAKNSGLMGNLRAVLVEDKSSGTGLIQETSGKLPVPVTPIPRERDKLTRAMDAQAHHIAKKVVLPYDDASNFEFVSEVASFTHDDSHKHDDQTDVMIDAIGYALIQPATARRTSKVTW